MTKAHGYNITQLATVSFQEVYKPLMMNEKTEKVYFTELNYTILTLKASWGRGGGGGQVLVHVSKPYAR